MPRTTRVYQNHHLDSTRWQHIEPRDGDIIVTTSYKSGTTWTQGILNALLHPTREEDGCLGYELLENLEDPTEFRFVEEWTDDAAFGAHFDTPHIQAAAAAFEGVLAADLDVQKYRLVG